MTDPRKTNMQTIKIRNKINYQLHRIVNSPFNEIDEIVPE